MRPICSPDLWPAASHRIKTNSYGLKKKKKSSRKEGPICLSGNNVTLQLFVVSGAEPFFFLNFVFALIITRQKNKLHLKLVKNNKNKINSIHQVYKVSLDYVAAPSHAISFFFCSEFCFVHFSSFLIPKCQPVLVLVLHLAYELTGQRRASAHHSKLLPVVYKSTPLKI